MATGSSPPRTRFGAKLAAIALVVVLVGVGCGSKSTDSSGIGGTATASTATQPTISKADLIEQVDAICAAHGAAVQAVVPVDPTNVDEVTQYFRRYVDLSRVAVDEAEALGPPDTDVQEWQQLIADMHTFVDLFDANLDQVVGWAVANDGAGFLASEVGQAQQRWVNDSKAFGLKVCGTPIGRTSSA